MHVYSGGISKVEMNTVLSRFSEIYVLWCIMMPKMGSSAWDSRQLGSMAYSVNYSNTVFIMLLLSVRVSGKHVSMTLKNSKHSGKNRSHHYLSFPNDSGF